MLCPLLHPYPEETLVVGLAPQDAVMAISASLYLWALLEHRTELPASLRFPVTYSTILGAFILEGFYSMYKIVALGYTTLDK